MHNKRLIVKISLEPIGFIRMEFQEKSGVPIQAAFGIDHRGIIELDPQYVAELKDLDGFSHIHLLYIYTTQLYESAVP